MPNLNDEEDPTSKEFMHLHIGILATISFIISIIITVWFFRKKCNGYNIAIFWLFNFSMAAFSIFPLISSYDNYFIIMEKIGVYDEKELEPTRKKIRTYYKIIHYVYYAISDIGIPLCNTIYLKRYLAKKDDNEQYKCFSCSILKGFLFFIITIVVFAIGAIVIVCVLPEPKLEEVKENTEGWDGIMFNLRNIISVAEYDANILLSAFLFMFKAANNMSWLSCCCKDIDGIKEQMSLFVFWKIGRLIEKQESKDEDKLSDFDIAKKELQEERNDYLADKLSDDYKKDIKVCNKIRNIYEFPIFIFFVFLAAFILSSECDNTFCLFTRYNYREIKEIYEKSEDKEEIKKGIFSDFVLFFVMFIIYFVATTYSIVTKNFDKEYFPYIGSERNGYGFLILLEHMIRIQPPIYFIVFFPLMCLGHKPIIANYFRLFKITMDYNYWPFVKGISNIIILFFCFCLGFSKDGIFKVFRQEHSNHYVEEGKKKCGLSLKKPSSSKTIELDISEESSIINED